MDPREYLQLQQRLTELTDEQLIRMLAIERADYREEAIQLARGELSRRGLDELNAQEYWARPDQKSIQETGFCLSCVAETTDASPGDTRTIFGIGTYLMGIDGGCPTCGSVVQTKYLSFFYIPIRQLGRYRIVNLPHDWLVAPLGRRYLGRQLIEV
jgi:hypothetical protein